MADPVAEKSTFLRMYMSNHPDTLVAYAKWYGKVTEAISSAEMTEITTKAMILTCTMKKDGSKNVVKVDFNPPLAGYDDVKPRLLEMKAIAQENLGMIKTPQITSFVLPFPSLYTGIFCSALSYLAWAPKHSTSPVFGPAHLIHSFTGATAFKGLFYLILAAHVAESAYTAKLCRTHRTGFFVGAQYTIATLFFGFAIWGDLHKRIQAARIDSVMKVE